MGRCHVLTEKNTETRRGTCAECGPDTPIRPRKTKTGSTTWVCRRPGEPRESKENKARRVRKAKHGLTTEQMDEIQARYGDGCAICGKGDKLVLDHCHRSGDVRGWLCTSCNNGLGLFRDDPTLFQKAIAYLSA